jgi:AraC-like DNA-binding protein
LSPAWISFFTELTGMRLHVHWPGTLELEQAGSSLFLCPAARSKCCAGALPLNCQSCIQRFWPSAGSSVREESRFEGLCGITNFCVVFRAGGSFPPLVTLVLQASLAEHDATPGLNGSETMPAVPGPAPSDSNMPSSAFVQAVEMLRMRVCELDAVVQVWLAHHELEHMRELLRNLESENASLRKAVHHRLPDLPNTPAAAPFNTRAQQIVQEMVHYIHEHYRHPLSLGDVAAALKMNASYISSLFSQTLGVTFHSYLEEFRISKARELLRNPHSRVCEVACAVGYTSPDQFRHVFKVRVGVPPSAWRFKAG